VTRHLAAVPDDVVPGATGNRLPRIRPDRRCGYVAGATPCRNTPKTVKTTPAIAALHRDPDGIRRPWGQHDIQCQIPNPSPGPGLDGYPECSMADGHDGDCDYRRHVAEPDLVPAGAEADSPGLEDAT
jgi:hypothetical protein